MASIRKRGNSYTITAYMGYDEQGRQRKKTTTFTPPDGVTPGKAEKLAKAYVLDSRLYIPPTPLSLQIKISI